MGPSFSNENNKLRWAEDQVTWFVVPDNLKRWSSNNCSMLAQWAWWNHTAEWIRITFLLPSQRLIEVYRKISIWDQHINEMYEITKTNEILQMSTYKQSGLWMYSCLIATSAELSHVPLKNSLSNFFFLFKESFCTYKQEWENRYKWTVMQTL